MTAPKIKCPKCQSDQLTAQKKGFSATKAVGGAILTGGIGLLAGTIGSGKIQITCLSCGHQFKPGEDLIGLQKKEHKEEERRKTEAKAMKSPLYWIILISFFAIIFWLFKGCFF